MADYIVKDTELTSVANAIRTAGGTNSLLSFPNGFVSAVGNISGGGGSSDFSTATMTIVNNKSEVINFAIPSVFEENAMGEASPACIYTLPNIPASESVSITVPLYKGKILIDNPFSQDIGISGSVELILGNAMFSITGDCTINVLDIF